MNKVNYADPITASTKLRERTAVYFGYTVTVVTATAAVLVRDGVDNTGTIIDVIPIGTTAGTTKSLAQGLALTDGLFIDFNGGTGTLVIHLEP
jgi:hypothetical protein